MSEPEKGSLNTVEARGDDKVGVDTVNSVDGDEALRLVGAVRTTQFSEEYNLKLRRKLVCPNSCASVSPSLDLY